MSYRIAIVVHGRFEAFDLARELLARGHDVVVFTNYPKREVHKFGVPGARVRSFLAHGILTRSLSRLLPVRTRGTVERFGNSAFGRWAARAVPCESWDVVLAFSGVAEDLFHALSNQTTVRVLQRGSSHIRTQLQLLEEEERRIGRWVEKPSDWIVGREEGEYELADAIQVLSGFAEQSFLEQGIDADKLYRLQLGVHTASFAAPAETVEARCRRLVSDEPLRVLNVGTFSIQKGAWDMQCVIQTLRSEPFEFRFVGPVASDANAIARSLRNVADFAGKKPQRELPAQYRWGDLFLLPTIQDGFAVVLTQALASGLPLLTTTNCAGPDLVREGETGWVVPIRRPDAIVKRLRWCHEHRAELVRMVRNVQASSNKFDWEETARQAEANFAHALYRKRRHPPTELNYTAAVTDELK
jgi:glycosyltransferase involved in cell wall biosynthesis